VDLEKIIHSIGELLSTMAHDETLLITPTALGATHAKAEA